MPTSQLISQAQVTNNLEDESKYYLRLAETTFKERYSNHKVRLKMIIVTTVQNFPNMFGH